jgi:hypothetical protein
MPVRLRETGKIGVVVYAEFMAFHFFKRKDWVTTVILFLA